jgi:hypothetical protein
VFSDVTVYVETAILSVLFNDLSLVIVVCYVAFLFIDAKDPVSLKKAQRRSWEILELGQR